MTRKQRIQFALISYYRESLIDLWHKDSNQISYCGLLKPWISYLGLLYGPKEQLPLDDDIIFRTTQEPPSIWLPIVGYYHSRVGLLLIFTDVITDEFIVEFIALCRIA